VCVTVVVWLWNGVWPRKYFQSKYFFFALTPLFSVNKKNCIFLQYSLIMTLKYGILSQSTAVFPQSVENVVNTWGVMIQRYGSIYQYNVWRYDASMPHVKYRYLLYKKAPLFWHCPHFHIMSVYALPPTCAFSFNLTYRAGLDIRTAWTRARN